MNPFGSSVNKQFPVLLALMAVLVALAGCNDAKEETVSDNQPAGTSDGPCAWVADGDLPVVEDLDQRLDGYVQTELSPDLSHLDDTQTLVLEKLVAASKLMSEIFLIQATPCRDALADRIADLPAARQAGVARYFAINGGPWDRRFHHEPFFGTWPHPEGANYYPLDLTEADKEFIADGNNGMDGLFTMIRRGDDGSLQAVPYSEFFAPQLKEAARLLREAAALTENPSLKAFLETRAAAFGSDDYFESDMLWMDLDSTVEITIGPYETYEDGLFGYKAAFESFVTVTDPVESGRLAKFKDELPWLESRLPIPDEHKNMNRGSESPIRVVDEVYSAGDTRAGIQTIAFNLPNDERVREAKGSKKVLLRNVMKAKFDQILMPIAEVLVAEDQLGDLTSESFFLHTLWHEMSHGLGPGKITVDGRKTEVRLELKETYSTLEEAKADAMGEWDIFVLTRAGKGYFPDTIFKEQSATYLAGLFRSVRFGIGEAHGQANAIQYNYLMEKEAITVDENTGRFSIDAAVFEKAIEELVAEICLIQAAGDYDASVRFIEQYGGMAPSLAAALEKLADIPVDIEPVFSRYDK
ncbi:MAG: peptidase [Candidatus Krumholzibacteriota bacterium]